MHNYKLLIFFSLLVLSVSGLKAGEDAVQVYTDSIPKGADEVRLEQIEKKISRSPHYKNPNAAGRLAVFNRTAPAPKGERKEPLTGPAYKNRKRTPDASARVTKPRKQLMGPRYKNRRAGAHRSGQ